MEPRSRRTILASLGAAALAGCTSGDLVYASVDDGVTAFRPPGPSA